MLHEEGRNLERLGLSPARCLPMDVLPMQGCLPLSQPWPFPRSQRHLTAVTYRLQGSSSRSHLVWTNEHPCDMIPGLPPPFGLWCGSRRQGVDGSRVVAQEDGQKCLGESPTHRCFWLWISCGKSAGEVRMRCWGAGLSSACAGYPHLSTHTTRWVKEQGPKSGQGSLEGSIVLPCCSPMLWDF